MEKRKKWEIMAEEVDRLAAKIDNLEKSAAKETPKHSPKEGTMINVTGLIAEIPKLSVRVSRLEGKLGESTVCGITHAPIIVHPKARLGEIITSPEYQKLMRDRDFYKGQLVAAEQRIASLSQSRDHFRELLTKERERGRFGMVYATPIEHKADWKENIFCGFFAGLILLGGWKLVELIATLIF